jgi:hypothetical protein
MMNGRILGRGGLRALSLFAVAGVVLTVGSVGVPTPAGARVTPTTGSVRCSITFPVMTFTPGLRDKDHISGIQKGRGRAKGTFTAALGGCTDVALGPAPGGIDHGSLHANTRVAGSYCNLGDGIKLGAARIDWFRADNTPIGSSKLRAAVSVQPGFDHFYAPETATFTGSAKPSAKVLPGDTLSLQLDTVNPTWAVDTECFKLELSSLALVDGTLIMNGAI